MKYFIFLLLFLTPTTYAGTVTVSFTHDAPASVDGYEILWSSSTGDTGRQTLPSDQFSWTHKDLAAGQSITYQAYAFKGDLYSDPSDTATAVLHAKNDPPANAIPIPIYVAPTAPLTPGITFECSGDIRCSVQ